MTLVWCRAGRKAKVSDYSKMTSSTPGSGKKKNGKSGGTVKQ